jgi:uncharacterized membrane protein
MEKWDAKLLLKITFGVLPILVGLDKIFFNVIAQWDGYISPVFASLIPFSLGTFTVISGVVEVIVGLVVLSKFTKIGAYIVVFWLLGITVNLLFLKAWDIALRDFVLALSALSYAFLCEKR